MVTKQRDAVSRNSKAFRAVIPTEVLLRKVISTFKKFYNTVKLPLALSQIAGRTGFLAKTTLVGLIVFFGQQENYFNAIFEQIQMSTFRTHYSPPDEYGLKSQTRISQLPNLIGETGSEI
ncbi:hypothetical protein X801_00027 [Opisthorchis viverrini]|uniref:Uncharacterized protein n=1 Tax=Opisthorchis viverrini TaxID=6198 RepID=A0A1S8XBG1_OPIVI|nr:hypothetical protein X801_00027 [Opisthorchis viverrini]